ncbi:MAG: hypothetical protein MZV65_12895 [Chromatiales bacterium]|nr:hypothetical protein [Chromatiales bacterium]
MDRIEERIFIVQADQRQERPEPHRRCRRLLDARQQDRHLQGQGHPAGRRRLREPVPSAFRR